LKHASISFLAELFAAQARTLPIEPSLVTFCKSNSSTFGKIRGDSLPRAVSTPTQKKCEAAVLLAKRRRQNLPLRRRTIHKQTLNTVQINQFYLIGASST
jgi:hypothetical protein